MSQQVARGGRPPKLTVALIDAICQAIRTGQYLTDACQINGVHKMAVYHWLRYAKHATAKLNRGEPITPHEKLCIRFADALPIAQSEGYARLVARIVDAGTRPQVTRTTRQRWTGQFDERGNPVYAAETTVIEAPPDVRALIWRASKLRPAPVEVDLTVHTDEDAEADRIAREAARRLAELQARPGGLRALLDDNEIVDAELLDDVEEA